MLSFHLRSYSPLPERVCRRLVHVPLSKKQSTITGIHIQVATAMRKAGGLAGVLVTRLCLVGLAVHRTSAWHVAPPIAAKGAARYMLAANAPAHRPRIASAQRASRHMMMVSVAGDGAVSADTTKREEAAERELMSAAELALRDLPKAEMECWRPTTDDVACFRGVATQATREATAGER